MTCIRVATFNVENLFARNRFKTNVEPAKAVPDGWNANDRYFDIFDATDKAITAQAILALKDARYSGPRFPKVGTSKPKASDHCPVVMEVPL